MIKITVDVRLMRAPDSASVRLNTEVVSTVWEKIVLSRTRSQIYSVICSGSIARVKGVLRAGGGGTNFDCWIFSGTHIGEYIRITLSS